MFWTEQDYDAFERLMIEAKRRQPVSIFSYTLMPNHWHFLLSPRGDADLPKFMHWLSTTHTRRWNVAHDKCGNGAVYQGRYKAIPMVDEEHAVRVCRYIERNALRANLVGRAEEWRWCSLHVRLNRPSELVDVPPFALPANWVDVVNSAQSQAEVDAIRAATEKNVTYGPSAGSKRRGNHTRHRVCDRLLPTTLTEL